jgi:GR25 family glycosyltransferase involved in LPS biosynthesis
MENNSQCDENKKNDSKNIHYNKEFIYDIINHYKIKNVYFNNDENNSYFINKTVEKIYVINLHDNEIRRNYIILLMAKYKINFNLVIVERIHKKIYQKILPNEDITKEELGCTLSHLWCLNKIIKKNIKNAIIFEDDVIFHKNFIHMFEKIYNDTYEFLLLGACDFSFKNLNCKNVVDGLYVPHHDSKMVFGAHANYYSLKGATHMFKETLENFSFFDKHYMNIFDFFKNTSFICFPNLVVTDISTTNLQHKYTLFSRLEESYYLNCFNNDFNFNDYNFIYLILFINAPKLKLKKYNTSCNYKY